MNALDAVLALMVLISVLRGAVRGLLAGLLDLVGLVFVVAVALLGYAGLAPVLTRVAGLGPEIARLAAFFGLVILASVLYALLSNALLYAGRGRRRPGPLGRVLGALPGLAQGVAVASLLVAALSLLPLPGPIVAQAEGSALAPPLRRLTARLTPELARVLPGDATTPLLQISLPGAGGGRQLRFPKDLALAVEERAERRMLALINRDRARTGLRPLIMDKELRAVARAHSREMFRLSYFAHESPRTGSPQDRLDAAGIAYLAAGENLAYQPDVETAHRALMNSPGHRENILSPLYRRVGIGIIRGELYGAMYTQEFAG